ncbi:hypothetical protein M3J09_002696 [Ascochyta lentis]
MGSVMSPRTPASHYAARSHGTADVLSTHAPVITHPSRLEMSPKHIITAQQQPSATEPTEHNRDLCRTRNDTLTLHKRSPPTARYKPTKI